jgi:hypothetical protein
MMFGELQEDDLSSYSSSGEASFSLPLPMLGAFGGPQDGSYSDVSDSDESSSGLPNLDGPFDPAMAIEQQDEPAVVTGERVVDEPVANEPAGDELALLSQEDELPEAEHHDYYEIQNCPENKESNGEYKNEDGFFYSPDEFYCFVREDKENPLKHTLATSLHRV